MDWFVTQTFYIQDMHRRLLQRFHQTLDEFVYLPCCFISTTELSQPFVNNHQTLDRNKRSLTRISNIGQSNVSIIEDAEERKFMYIHANYCESSLFLSSLHIFEKKWMSCLNAFNYFLITCFNYNLWHVLCPHHTLNC